MTAPLSDLAAGRACACIYECHVGIRKRRGRRCSYCRMMKCPTRQRVWPDPTILSKRSGAYQRSRDRYWAIQVLSRVPGNYTLSKTQIKESVDRWNGYADINPVIAQFCSERVERDYFGGERYTDALQKQIIRSGGR